MANSKNIFEDKKSVDSFDMKRYKDNDGSSSHMKHNEQISESTIVHITNLPAEIFQHILRYLTFDNIAKIRLVSRYFNDMCSSLLNSEFNRLRVLVQQKFLALKAQMPRRESSRRKHPLARESDIIETLYMRLTLLNMTFGKQIERKYCCFFAGEIIDEIYKILRYVENTPSLSRAYKVTDELFDLSTMAMEYFKEHIEPLLPEVTYFASDVFEYPSFSSVKAQHSIFEETAAVAASAETSYSPNCAIQRLNKRLKIMGKKVNKNSIEIANLKRSARAINQKINSLGEVINQMKWKQKSCETNALPHTINESHKLSEITVQLNMCKQEIEHLTSKLSVCSDKDSKVKWDSLESNMSNINNLNFIGNPSINITSSLSSDFKMNPKESSLEIIDSKEHSYISSPPLVSLIPKLGKRKLANSTITSVLECPELKRNCNIEELNDSGIQEEQISCNS